MSNQNIYEEIKEILEEEPELKLEFKVLKLASPMKVLPLILYFCKDT